MGKRQPGVRVVRSLWQAQQRMGRAADVALGRLGLTRVEAEVMSLLERAPALSGSELARRLGLSVQGVATALGKLEGRRFVRRRPHPAHLRLYEVFLTAEGRKRLGRAERALAGVEARLLEGLSRSERAALSRGLERLLAG